MAGNEDVSIKVSADTSDLEAAMSRSLQAVNASMNSMKQSIEQLKEPLDSIKNSFDDLFAVGKFVAAYEGVKKIAEAMDALAVKTLHVTHTAEMLGIGTPELQGLNAAAEEAGVGSEQLQQGLLLLSMKMQQARDGSQAMRDKLAAVGITLDDLKDPSFTAASAGYAIANSHATAAEKLDVVGRRGIALIEVLTTLKGGSAAAEEKARSLGATTEEEAERLKTYHAAVADATLKWEYFETRIVADVAPALVALIEQLGNMFDVTSTGSDTLDFLGKATRAVASEFLKWAEAVKELYIDVKEVFEKLGTSIGNVGAVINAAAHGQFAEAKHIWDMGTADLLQIEKDHDAAILAARTQLAAALTAVDESVLTGVTVTAKKKDSTPNTVADTTKVQKESTKYLDDLMRENEKYFQEAIRMSEEESKTFADTEIGKVAVKEKSLAEQLKLGDVSAKEYLKQENDLISERLSAQITYLNEKKALEAAAGRDTKQIDDDIARAEAAADKERAQADATARQAQLAQWKQFASQIGSAFSTAIKGMINGTETLGEAIRNIFSSVIDALINMFVQMAVAWAEKQVMMMVMGRTSAEANVSAHVAEAGAAGVASFAGAPWPIDLGAPAFGAAMALDAASYAVAEKGFDVPSGVNPLTQLHAREMVLPASLADTVRQGAASGGGRGRSPSVNFPGKQMGNVFSMHMDDLKDAINSLMRTRTGRAGAF